MLDFILMTPVYQGVDGMTSWCVEMAHQAMLNKFLWVVGTDGKGDALICRNRSIAATSFMEAGKSDYMIFLDSDIVFKPEHLKLLHENLKAGHHIIGGMYPTRSGTDNSSYFFKGIAPNELGIHEIQFLSTGFMGISRYALYKIANEYQYPGGVKMPLLHANTPGFRSYPFFEARWGKVDPPDQDGCPYIWFSEDWDFCEKARAVGLKIYGDTRIQLGHVGSRVVTFNDVLAYKTKKAELERQVAEKKEAQQRDRGEYVDYVAVSAEGARC